MIQPLLAQLDAVRLGAHQRDLRRREQDALVRLGQTVVGDGGARGGRLAVLATEAAGLRGRLDALAAERRTAPAARRAELQRRREGLEQKLHELHLTAGRLAMAMPAVGGGGEVQAIREELANTASERERLHGETRRHLEEMWGRCHAWLAPRSPAIAGMALGWWIASRYTDAHLKEIMKSLGLSLKRGGSHLVSLPTDKLLIGHGLPLVAALVCAYLGHRVARWGYAVADAYRARSSNRLSGSPSSLA